VSDEPNPVVEPVETTTTPPQDSVVEPVETSTPLLRIVKGDPEPEEVAALVAVVSSMAAAAAEAASRQQRPTSAWSAHHRKLRGAHRHGAGNWRTSARG
jgi:hypothetical protein